MAGGLRAYAPAKVNLYLHVGPARKDGRHPLDSLVVFAGREAADRLELTVADDTGLDVEGPFAEEAGPIESNLVLEAYRRLCCQVRLPGDKARHLQFVLNKYLPAGAGIGGGSADAAAALRLMVLDHFKLSTRTMTDIAPQLGGDVLACVWNRPVLMRGDGDDVIPLDDPKGILKRGPGSGLPAVLVNPGMFCPTGPVFRRFDEMDVARELDLQPLTEVPDEDALLSWLRRDTKNDLQAAACDLVPEIAFVLEQLEAQAGVRLARMSGSGATCFAVFDDMGFALESQARLSREHPDWWVRATLLGEGAQ
ncbi:MAG: 4-(cytidine 5'-diphospho)-2-C-methyl-D-erythritol kinase [Pseudomonadota bacterium]